LASAILDPSKPDCDIDPMDPKKNMDVYNIRFSTGSASYFYDAIDEMLTDTFKSDV